MKIIRKINRKKRVKNKHSANKGSLKNQRLSVKNVISKDDESENIKLFLTLPFKVEEYSAKVHYPENMKLHWRSNIYRNPVQLAKRHFQKIVKLARFDQSNLTRHIKYLNEVTHKLSFMMDSSGMEFDGLTKEQVRECGSNKDFEFEIIEISC